MIAGSTVQRQAGHLLSLFLFLPFSFSSFLSVLSQTTARMIASQECCSVVRYVEFEGLVGGHEIKSHPSTIIIRHLLFIFASLWQPGTSYSKVVNKIFGSHWSLVNFTRSIWPEMMTDISKAAWILNISSPLFLTRLTLLSVVKEENDFMTQILKQVHPAGGG